jgi:hypothetical protein
MAYSQGISDALVERLNALHASPEGQWWRDMLADPELFAAIRHNYLNVYYRGCSLAKISLDGGEIVAETHYKYLLKPSLNKPYVRAVAGEFQLDDRWPSGLHNVFTHSLTDVAALKSAAKPYAGDEKKFVGKVIESHPNVVDVEIALTKDSEEATDADPGKGASAKRIDIAALRWNGSQPILDFYEAKLFGNKELRAQGEAKVINQIRTYESLLAQYTGNIQIGFQRACVNIASLQGFPEGRVELAKRVLDADVAVSVNIQPILIIGGFDKDQRDGDVWVAHLKKLTGQNGLDGAHRIILAGKAKDVRLGQGNPIIEQVAV